MLYFKKIHVAITFLMVASVGVTYGEYYDVFSFRPTCCECGNTFITADLLFWRPFEGGLDTCIPDSTTDTTTSGTVISTLNGTARDPHFRWTPGFRIGAGYEPADCGWDFGASWTHFHSHANANGGRWNIDLDVVDAIAGYEYCLSPCFVLRPFAGLRGARIDQQVRVNEFIASELTTINTNNKEDFWGVGPLIGLEGDWKIGCGFSLFASGSISWLYGKFDVRLIDSTVTADSASYCNVGKNLDASLAGADAAIGIRWCECFCSTELLLQVALEHHRYFDYNRIGGYGDLSFDGVTLSAGLEY